MQDTYQEFLQFLKGEIELRGLRGCARYYGIASFGTLKRVADGAIPPYPLILRQLGWSKIVTYERRTNETENMEYPQRS